MVCAKLALLAVAASTFVLAQPHGHRHLAKRDLVYATVTAPIKYVDQNGNVINAPVATGSPVESGASASSTAAQGIIGKAIVYSPYHNDGTCKNAADVATDLNTVIGTNKAYGGIRLYGVDCNQVANVLPVAKTLGVKVMLGIYDITQCATAANTIVSAVAGDWSHVHSIAVGNEEVNKAFIAGGAAAAAAAVPVSLAAAASVKTIVQAAGFNGDVVTPEVFIHYSTYPALCGSASFVATNMHPFFDGNVAAADVTSFYTNQYANVQKACGGKKVLVTETGWPTGGANNNQAVPSKPNQDSVISQACTVLKDDLIILGAYNDNWKANFAGSFSAETMWGVHGNSPTN